MEKKKRMVMYRIFVGDVAQVGLFEEAWDISGLPIDGIVIERHNGMSCVGITQELCHKFLDAFYRTNLFEPWKTKLARMN